MQFDWRIVLRIAWHVRRSHEPRDAQLGILSAPLLVATAAIHAAQAIANATAAAAAAAAAAPDLLDDVFRPVFRITVMDNILCG